MTIGKLIRGARKELSLSQAALARAIGVSGKAIGVWERGESEPEDHNLCAAMEYLGIEWDEVIAVRKAAA